ADVTTKAVDDRLGDQLERQRVAAELVGQSSPLGVRPPDRAASQQTPTRRCRKPTQRQRGSRQAARFEVSQLAGLLATSHDQAATVAIFTHTVQEPAIVGVLGAILGGCGSRLQDGLKLVENE